MKIFDLFKRVDKLEEIDKKFEEQSKLFDEYSEMTSKLSVESHSIKNLIHRQNQTILSLKKIIDEQNQAIDTLFKIQSYIMNEYNLKEAERRGYILSTSLSGSSESIVN